MAKWLAYGVFFVVGRGGGVVECEHCDSIYLDASAPEVGAPRCVIDTLDEIDGIVCAD